MLQGLNQDLRDHESSSASEHLRLMAARNSTLEAKVTRLDQSIPDKYMHSSDGWMDGEMHT